MKNAHKPIMAQLCHTLLHCTCTSLQSANMTYAFCLEAIAPTPGRCYQPTNSQRTTLTLISDPLLSCYCKNSYSLSLSLMTIGGLRRFLSSCLCATSADAPAMTTTTASTMAAATNTSTTTAKNRLSATLNELFKDRHQPPEEEDSLIDAAASHYPPSPSRSLVVGTIYGHRNGHVSFCVQHDPATPPPFLYELSVPTHLLAREMRAGLVRIALECDREVRDSLAPRRSFRSAPMWKAYCNGRRVGYAVRRRPTDKDILILRTVRSMTCGAGVLMPGELGAGWEEGELMYMRSSYERVVGSRDSVSYHLVNPGGSPGQELSVFLLRTG